MLSDPTSPRHTIGQGSTQLGGLRKQTLAGRRYSDSKCSGPQHGRQAPLRGWLPNAKRAGILVTPKNPLGWIAQRDGAKCRSVCTTQRDIKSLGRRIITVPQRSRDRKSTRLNSSHVSISYAVFCLKKKTTMY